MASQKDVNTLRALLSATKRVVVLAGAGLSTASGLSTFRGAGGLWRTFDAVSLATPQAFRQNPSRVAEFYEYRRQKALLAQPNAAHILLAELSLPSRRKTLLPACTSFTLITQNVDSLSPRALEAVRGSEKPDSALIEMHGSIVRPYCLRCGTVATERGKSHTPLAPVFNGVIERVDNGEQETAVPQSELPTCDVAGCGGLLRPGVVWFGETPHQMDECIRALEKADVLLVVGTSGVVYPAAGFASIVQGHGGRVAVFNIEPSSGDEDADFVVLGKCEETLPLVLGA